MKLNVRNLAQAVALFAVMGATGVDGAPAPGDWEVQRLMEPSPGQIERERAGRVVIYSGLTDRQVERALDRHFDRMGSMMFVGVVVTDADGEPRRDVKTGMIVTEDDGC